MLRNLSALKMEYQEQGRKRQNTERGRKMQEDETERHGPAGLTMIHLQLNWAYVSTYYPGVTAMMGLLICHL